MPPAAVMVAGAVAGGLQAHGAKQQQKKQNRMYGNMAAMYDPKNVNRRAQSLNPMMWNAMVHNERGDMPMQQAWHQFMQQIGQMNPDAKNMMFHRSNMDYQNADANMQARLGQTQMGGMSGLGAAMPFMNMASKTNRDMNAHANIGMYEDGKLMQDLGFLAQQYYGMQNNARTDLHAQTGILGQQRAPMTGSSILGNAIQGGLAAYGSIPTPAGKTTTAAPNQFGDPGFGMNPAYPYAPGNNGLWNGTDVTQGPSIFNPGAQGHNSAGNNQPKNQQHPGGWGGMQTGGGNTIGSNVNLGGT